MKKTGRIVLGAILAVSLVFGAVKTLVITPRTVWDADGILEMYYETRSGLPPLPPPVEYKTVLTQLNEGRFEFLSSPDWAFTHNGGTIYLSEKSKLKLLLPMQLVAYEDLVSGKVVLTGTALGSKKFQTLAVVEAPEFKEQEKDQTVENWLLKEIGPRRIIWTAILKSEEDAWVDLLSVEEQSLSSPMTMMMSMSTPPPEHTNDLWMSIDSTNAYVYAPSDFTNKVEIYKAESLVSDLWSVVAQDLTPSGTNPATYNFTGSDRVGFFQAGNTDIDSDEDDLPDAREIIVHNTDPEDSDSDNDLLSDYQEIHVTFTDPNNGDTNAPSILIAAPGSEDRKVVLP